MYPLSLILCVGLQKVSDLSRVERMLNIFPSLEVCRREFHHHGQIMTVCDKYLTEDLPPHQESFFKSVFNSARFYRKLWWLNYQAIVHYRVYLDHADQAELWESRRCLWKIKCNIEEECFVRGRMPHLELDLDDDEAFKANWQWQNFDEVQLCRSD